MSSFTTAMDNHFNGFVQGENGCLAHKTTSESLLDLFFKIVRGLTDIFSWVIKIIQEATLNNDPYLLANLFILTFQTRDIRGGKGERTLFYEMFLSLFKDYPDTCILLLPLIGAEYGSYLDYWHLLDAMNKNTSIDLKTKENLRNAIFQLYAIQLRKDELTLSEHKEDEIPILSLAAKWAPREKKKYANFAKKFARFLFPESNTPHVDYRKLISKLTRALDIPEVKMCADLYHLIDFKKVPSKCLNKNRKAFLNEMLKVQDLRHPDSESRNTCRSNLLLSIAKGKVNGKDMMPHELVKQLMHSYRSPSPEELSVYDAQWFKIKEHLQTIFQDFSTNPTEGAINLGNLVTVVDVSGSMEGTPMEASIALGILVSELSNEPFRNRMLTFHESPSWIQLDPSWNLYEKVTHTKNAQWGGSTNFQATYELILTVAIENKLGQEQLPDIIVFSDMQFNEADTNTCSMFQTMKTRFEEAGYSLPRIIFWNLRGNTTGFPVEANTENVQMLSGFSPNLLKLVLNGEPLVFQVVSEDGTIIQREITPLETMHKVLDDKRYDLVREIISLSSEKILANYHFERKEM